MRSSRILLILSLTSSLSLFAADCDSTFGDGFAIVSPTPCATLQSDSVTFVWTLSQDRQVKEFLVGHQPGTGEYFQKNLDPTTLTTGGDQSDGGGLGLRTDVQTLTLHGLPRDGSEFYVTIWYENKETNRRFWMWARYNFADRELPELLLPTPDETLDTRGQEITWSDVGALSYYLYVGTGQYRSDLLSARTDQLTTWRLPELPPNSEIWITIWSFIEGEWLHAAFTRQSGDPGSGLPLLVDDFFSVLSQDLEVPDGKLSMFEIKNPQGLTNATLRLVPDQNAVLTRITPYKALDINGANETINISLVDPSPAPGSSTAPTRLGLNVSQPLSDMVSQISGLLVPAQAGRFLDFNLSQLTGSVVFILEYESTAQMTKPEAAVLYQIDRSEDSIVDATRDFPAEFDFVR